MMKVGIQMMILQMILVTKNFDDTNIDTDEDINSTVSSQELCHDDNNYASSNEDNEQLKNTSSVKIDEKNVKISRSELALRNFLDEILEIFPKSEESKLQRLKIHQTVHYPHYIKKIGSVENFNGGPAEENMKSHVKNPGKKTQRRSISLAFQSSVRYAEKLIIDIGHT